MGLSGNEQLREFMDKLAVSNVSRYIELPMIAVMGDTSSGKSSLLTSISMVELPSSEKLTTRCPIMLQMKRGEKRCAEVTVEFKTDVSNNQISYSFSESVDESSWDELTGHISGAQDYIMKQTAKTGENDVARDIVKVRVVGPDCEDLTLIDLPGIVRSTGAGESASLVQDIQSLIDDYLANSRCVILAVHPANVDFHNSQIMADAKKVDPETTRTLPVITKPDLIDVGAEDGVKDLLLGRKTDRFERGFHMVKGRGQKALNDKQSIRESLDEEEDFFRNTSPWKNVESRSLFGTKELRTKLGMIQIQLVRDTFPDIRKEMEDQKEEAVEEMTIMGEMCETIADKRHVYLEIVRQIIKDIDLRLKGNIRRSKRLKLNKTASVASTFHKYCEEFASSLRQGQLTNVTSLCVGSEVLVSHNTGRFPGTLLAKRNEFAFVEFDEGSIPAGMENLVTPRAVATFNKTDGEIWWDNNISESSVYRATGNGYSDMIEGVPIGKVHPSSSWIKKYLMDHRSLDLSIFPNPSVFSEIVASFIEDDWEQHCYKLIETTMVLLRDVVGEVVSEQKKLDRYPRLGSYLKAELAKLEKISDENARAELKQYISKEKKPYTQNDYLSENISRIRSKWFEQTLSEALGVDGTFSDMDTLSKSQIKTTIEAVFNQNRKKSLNDHMAEDMMHVLDSYGKVSFKRFADEVPKICKVILESFSQITEESLLDSPKEERLNVLICESPTDKERYEFLQQKVKDLDEGLQIIEGLAF